MNKFEVRDLEIIRNIEIPQSTLKRQIGNLLQDSIDCNALVDTADLKTGEYRIILEGRLEN